MQGSFASGPACPVFESDDLDQVLARRRLTPETLAFVRRMADVGGAVLELGDDGRALCDQAVAETEPYFADAKVSRVQDAWYRSPAVRRLASLPLIRQRLKAAFGRDPFPFQTINFRRGSEQPFHSDVMHFSSLPERFMCGVWIALEDVQPDSGPVVYRPGSHRLPIFSMRDAGVNSDLPSDEDYERHYVPRFAERLDAAGLPTQTVAIAKGQAFVWAANLAHGGSAIANPASTRRSLVVHFLFDRCLYYTPRLSNAQAGVLHLRLPPNVRTGLWKWPVVGLRPALLPWRMVRDAIDVRLRAEPDAT